MFDSLYDLDTYTKDGSETFTIVSGKLRIDLPDITDTQGTITYRYQIAAGDFDVRLNIPTYAPDSTNYGLQVGFRVGDPTWVDYCRLRLKAYSNSYEYWFRSFINSVAQPIESGYYDDPYTAVRVVRDGTNLKLYYYNGSWTLASTTDFGGRAANITDISFTAYDQQTRGGYVEIDDLTFAEGCPTGDDVAWTSTSSTTTSSTSTTTTTTTTTSTSTSTTSSTMSTLSTTTSSSTSTTTTTVQPEYMTAYSTQHKLWYDGTNYWRVYYDESLSSIRCDYSTAARLGVDPDDWTENAAARIGDAGVSTDLSIIGDDNDVYIVYSDGEDILGRKGTGYPATDFAWDDAVLIFDGSADGGDYYRPDIAKDAAGTRINVCAAIYVTSTEDWDLLVRRATAGDTIPTTANAAKTLATGIASIQCSSIRRGDSDTAGSLIALWKETYTTLKSAYRNGPDNVPAGGDDWEAAQTVATTADCSVEPGYNFSMTNVLETGATVVAYMNSDTKAALRCRPAGSAQAWGAEDVLSDSAGDTYPALGEHELYHFHVLWLDSSGHIRDRIHNVLTHTYTPTIDPYVAPTDVTTSVGASWLSVSDETPISYMIWQLGDEVKAHVVEITAVTTTSTTSTSTTTTTTSCSSTSTTLSTTSTSTLTTTTTTPPP